MREVVLRPGRDRSLRRRHPWVLSGSVASDPGPEAGGELVAVRAASGEVLGHGLFAPRSSLRVRLVAFGKEAPAEHWLQRGIAAAAALRSGDPLLAGTDAVRLVNAEGDGLPGLVVDRYADVAVFRSTSLGMALRRDSIVAALASLPGVRTVFERADATAARREGFEGSDGVRAGPPPDASVAIDERGRRYGVDVRTGQKTGFYLDQRDGRDLVERLACGRSVLDLFAYTGGFAAAAARGGAAAVTLVESSAPSLDAARAHVAANAAGVDARFLEEDAFAFVRRCEESFDLIVVDPPPLARRRSDVVRASRAYKDVLLHALWRAAPGAWLLCYRCSHHVGDELFRKVAFGASLDAGRPVRVCGALGAPTDHPVSLDHPEGSYLGGLLLRA